jgi:filamentous hemagglutinin family protein
MSQSTERRATRPVLPAGLARRVLAASIAAFGAAPGLALAQLPTGAVVVHGTAPITSSEGQMTIVNSANAVLNWQSFSIGTDNSVHFQQPGAASKVLNRVVGNDPSSILGSLSSNGEVWLVNPHGVLFGNQARIDVGGFVASTLGVTNDDFLTGRNRFGVAGTHGGDVLNQSTLTTSFGGRVWMIGGAVRNEGTIETSGGQIVLAAGQSIDLVDSGMPNVTVRVSAPENEAVNLGSLLAPSGGSIDVHGAIVNQSGIVRADSVVSGSAGRVILRAEGDVRLGGGSVISASAIANSNSQGGSVLIESINGTASVQGDVLAFSEHSRGGQVQVLGREVNVGRAGEAMIAVRGNRGGGTALIGANTGLDAPRAQHTFVEGRIDASATDEGDGGTIVITSDGSTQAYGPLNASSGYNSNGVGGRIETSGVTLDVGGDINLWGAAGAGSWLARAANITVANRSGALPRAGDGQASTSATGADSVIDNNLIGAALAYGARVELQANGEGSAGQSGNIIVAGDIDVRGSSASGAALALEARGAIVLEPRMTIQGGESGMALSLQGGSAVRLGPNSAIATHGGDVRIIGTGSDNDIYIVDATVDAGSGDIDIAGGTVEIGQTSLKADSVLLSGNAVHLDFGTDIVSSAAAGSRGVSINGGTLTMKLAAVRSTGSMAFGAADIWLDSSLLESSTPGDAVILSSPTLLASGSRIETPNGRWLAYINSVRNWNDLLGYDQLGYQFLQVGNESTIPPVVANQSGVIVGAPMDVRVEVYASRTYDGTTRATFSRALSNDLAPAFTLQGNDRTVEGQFTDKHVGSGKTITYQGSEPVFGIVTSTGQTVYGARQTYVADITPRTITAANLAAASKIYDATRTAAVSGTVSGALEGDSVSLEGATGLFVDKHVGVAKQVTIGSASLVGTDARNYQLADATVLADIAPRMIGIAGLAALDKTYDGTRAASLAGALTDVFDGDSVGVLGASAEFDSKQAGIDKTVTLTGASLTGADARNYQLRGTQMLQADITPREIAATSLRAQDKVYDGTRGTTWSGALGGIVEGDNVQLGAGTAQFADKAASAGKTVTITGAGLTGADATNYRLTALPTVSASITPRALGGASLTVLDKVYDGTRTANLSGTLSGIVAGDSVRLDAATGLFDSKQAGIGKTVTISGGRLAGADAGNYTVSADTTGTGNITPRPITASGVTALDKVYDGTRNATLAGALSGVLAGDSVSLNNATGLFSDKHAGIAKAVTISGAALGGADAGNYTLQGAPNVMATITPRPIAATGFAALDKVYDGTLAAQLSGSLTDVLQGDTVALDAVGAFDSKNVGTGKAVTITGALRGPDAANYALSLPTRANAAITHRPLDIVVTGTVSKGYDATLLASLAPDAYLLDGVVAGDTLAVRGPAQGSFDSANIGQARPVRASGLFDITGQDAANYRVGAINLTGTSNQVEATALGNVGTIRPATLVYEASPGMAVGGLNVGALGGTVSGFKGADTLASATTGTLQWQTPVNAASTPGAHPVYGGGLAAPNYVFVQAPSNDAALTLMPGAQASALPQRAQESSNEAISTALAAVVPPVVAGAMDSAGRGAVIDSVGGATDTAVAGAMGEAVASAAGSIVTEQSGKPSARVFEPVDIASMEQVDLEQLLVQRRDFKRKTFADAVYKLALDPSLADVRPCAKVIDADTGNCRITPEQLAQLHAAKTPATQAARSGKARVASVPQIERKIALLVGINAYSDKNIPQLKNAISDADAVAKIFAAKLGYDVRVLRNPDKATIIRTLNALATEVGSEDSVVIYFAGHGFSMDNNGAGYWLASDATATDELKGWISNSDVAQMLSGIRSKQVTLISDSCYSGAFAREGLGAVGQNVTVDGVLAKRSVVVLSSGGDEPVPDNGKAGHSIFAWNLMKVLNSVTNWTPGSSVFADVQARVRKEFPQTPRYGSVTAAGHQAGGDYLFESRSN